MEKPAFGVPLGDYKGVVGYSNRKAGWGAGPNHLNGHFTGYKYQCVEYARRFMIQAKNQTFESIDCAYDIWDLDRVFDVSTGEPSPFFGIPNGSTIPPVPDALLIFQRGPKVPWGHVAVITEVSITSKYIRIADQNDDDWHWPGNYSRQLRLETSEGKYWIRDRYHIIGWMVYENLDSLVHK
jgi:hypothetical protein